MGYYTFRDVNVTRENSDNDIFTEDGTWGLGKDIL